MTKNDHFRVVSLNGNKLTIEYTLEAPSPDNRSKGTKAVIDGKEQGIRDGKTYVIGKAFGKLPFTIGGKELRINTSIMLPVENKDRADVKEVSFSTPPAIPPVAA